MPKYAQKTYGGSYYGGYVLDHTRPEDVLDRDPWDRDPGGDEDYLIVEDGDGGTDTIALYPDRLMPYKLEVRSATGGRVKHLTRWFDGTLIETVNKGRQLSFSIPYDDASNVEPPNLIWLRNTWDNVIGRFVIQNRSPRQQMGSTFLRVECQDALSQLSREVLIQYEATPEDGATVGSIVADLLANYQVQDDPIGLGRIDHVIKDTTAALYIQQGTIMDAIRQLFTQVDTDYAGTFYVDNNRRFQWRKTLGHRKARILTVESNMPGIERTEDWSHLVTRLYMYGEGEDPATRLNLTDDGADQANEYIDSANTAVYGIRPMVIIDSRYRHGESLLLRAQQELAARDVPLYRYTVRVTDLFLADTPGYTNWAELFVGVDYRILAEDIDVDVELKILKITRSLDRPLDVTVEVGNETERLGDLMGGIIDQLHNPYDWLGNKYPYAGRFFPLGFSTDRNDFGYQEGDIRRTPGADPGEMEVFDDDAWYDIGINPLDFVGETEDIEPVGNANDAGTDDLIVRADHVHKGWYQAVDFASLPTPSPGVGARGYITAGAEEGQSFAWDTANTKWVSTSHLRTP